MSINSPRSLSQMAMSKSSQKIEAHAIGFAAGARYKSGQSCERVAVLADEIFERDRLLLADFADVVRHDVEQALLHAGGKLVHRVGGPRREARVDERLPRGLQRDVD